MSSSGTQFVLAQKPIEDASIDELMDVLAADNAVERIVYRKAATTQHKQDFIRIGKGATGQFQKDKDDEQAKHFNPIIGFKYIECAVPESGGHVTVTIEKKCDTDLSFWIRTYDDTATAPGDYEALHELITMKAKEQTRDIKIKIVDDTTYEPDKDFKVRILEEEHQKQYPGIDTECTVTILDEDRPGYIGFKERTYDVKRS